MKQLEKLLSNIRAWPEEARKLLAIISLILAAILIFVGWSAFTSARLGELINAPVLTASSEEKPKLFSPETSALGPAAGLADVLKNVFSLTGGGVEGLWKYIYEPLK